MLFVDGRYLPKVLGYYGDIGGVYGEKYHDRIWRWVIGLSKLVNFRGYGCSCGHGMVRYSAIWYGLSDMVFSLLFLSFMVFYPFSCLRIFSLLDIFFILSSFLNFCH